MSSPCAQRRSLLSRLTGRSAKPPQGSGPEDPVPGSIALQRAEFGEHGHCTGLGGGELPRCGSPRMVPCGRVNPWTTALVLVLFLTLGALYDLLRDGSSSMHLRAATLRAAGGSAHLGAAGICLLRVAEVAVVWVGLIAARRSRRCMRRVPTSPLLASPSQAVAGAGGLGGGSSVQSSGGLSRVNSSGALSGSEGSGGSTEGATLGASSGVSHSHCCWPTMTSGIVSDCCSSCLSGAGPPGHREGLSRRHAGGELLCTLSGWVWLLLGAFAVLGAICSLLVAMGGRTAPGMIGEMLSHHGPLGRRSVLGRSLPTLTWLCARPARLHALSRPLAPSRRRTALRAVAPPDALSIPPCCHRCQRALTAPLCAIDCARRSFEVGSAGALYVAILSLLASLLQLVYSAASRLASRLGPKAVHPFSTGSSCATPTGMLLLARYYAAGGAEPPLPVKLQSVGVHAAALAIAAAELYLNDLPVLTQHRPLALLLGCAYSLNLLAWHAHLGRFTYLYADAPRTSANATLVASVFTPAALAAAFTALASVSAAHRVR